jgi:hypothetical protein
MIGVAGESKLLADFTGLIASCNDTSRTLTIGQLRTDFSHAREFTPTKKGMLPEIQILLPCHV